MLLDAADQVLLEAAGYRSRQMPTTASSSEPYMREQQGPSSLYSSSSEPYIRRQQGPSLLYSSGTRNDAKCQCTVAYDPYSNSPPFSDCSSHPVDCVDDRSFESVRSMGTFPSTRRTDSAWQSGLVGFVKGSARLVLPGVQIILETARVSNSKRITFTSARIERSVALRHVDSVSNKSLESSTMDRSTSVCSRRSIALRRSFPSSIPSPTASVSADAIDLTGLVDLRELQDNV